MEQTTRSTVHRGLENYNIDIYFFFLGFAQPKIVEALLGYELVQVSCGASHVLAVTNEREVFAWGRGDNGIANQPAVFKSCSIILCIHLSVFACLWLIYSSNISSHSLTVGSLFHCLKGRLGLGTQDTHNAPQQVCLPAEFEAQRVVCGVDCCMIISTQHSIVACGSNR